MKAKCAVVLNPEIAKIIQPKSKIVLSVDIIAGGVGIGSISLNPTDYNKLFALFGENIGFNIRLTDQIQEERTSINTQTEEPILDEQYEQEENEDPSEQINDQNNEIEDFGSFPSEGSVGSIFSTNLPVNEPQAGPRSPVDRLAAIRPPESRAERAASIKPPEEIKTPEPFKHMDDPKIRKFIKDADEFYDSVIKNKNKKSQIDVESFTNNRQRAVAEEKKAQEESIGVPSYIVNEKYASLQINDLSISLPKDAPIDLSRFSAKRLYESNDLKQIIKQNMVRFVSPDEAQKIIEKTVVQEEEDVPDVFDNHRAAKQAISGEDSDDDYGPIDLENSLDGPTEQEKMASLLTDLTPRSAASGSRKSVHGHISQEKPKPGKVTHQQHKTIKRSF